MNPHNIVLQTPISNQELRKLKLGERVFVTGKVHTLRDMGHEKLFNVSDQGEKPPFDLRNGVVWHCGPIVKRKDDKWDVCVAGSTSSSRFTALTSRLLSEFGVKCVIGKGTMGKDAIEAMKKYGAVYLMSTGGAAALYASHIKEIENVHWLNLGMPEAVWVFEARKMGPFIVGIDSHGNSLVEEKRREDKQRLIWLYEEAGVKLPQNYVWWPKIVVGSNKFIELIKEE
ncbi:MAG: fumarate hydratase [Nitrososphaeria archaeon]|nr:fumarate hydratase [Nitrososphaeria archaeon]NIQ33693.1 fumarate hydratase [Nitrososphaeria archaeon]